MPSVKAKLDAIFPFTPGFSPEEKTVYDYSHTTKSLDGKVYRTTWPSSPAFKNGHINTLSGYARRGINCEASFYRYNGASYRFWFADFHAPITVPEIEKYLGISPGKAQ